MAARVQPGIKIALGFGAVLAAYYLGLPALDAAQVRSIKAPPITPDRVVMLGLAPSAGRIIVSNNVATVVDTGGAFGGNETADGGATEGAIKKRIPIQEMLRTFAGDGEALGRFVMKMNDVKTNGDDWPTEIVAWPAARIRKALDGDPVEKAALERDLNFTLEGKPLSKLSTRAFYNGIVVETPVSVTTEIDGKTRKVTGTYQQPFKPRVFAQLDKKLQDKGVTEEGLANEYGTAARRILDGAEKPEDLSAALRKLIDPALAKTRVEPVEALLRKASVVVNSKMIESASYAPRRTNDGTVYDLTIRLTDEGRKRLWKYSHDRLGTQILLVADGTAIAAPRITHELKEGELVIQQMMDESLVKDAVDMINDKSGKAVAAR